jgi:hypothetical protein
MRPCVKQEHACGIVGLLAILLLPPPSRGADAPTLADRAVEQMKTGELSKADAGVRSILEERGRLVQSLMSLCDPKQDSTSRAAAMYALGKLRAVEACEVLVDHILFAPAPFFGKKPPEVVELFGAYPARKALIEIGTPAVPHLLKRVRQSPEPFARMFARRAIVEIEGLRCARLILGDALTVEGDAEARQRLEEGLKAIEKQIKAREK